MTCDNPILPLGILAILNSLIAAAAVWKRRPHLLLIAAVASAAIEVSWATHCVGPNGVQEARAMFLAIQALFLGVCLGLTYTDRGNGWTIGAATVAGSGALLAIVHNTDVIDCTWDSGISTVLLSAAGLIMVAGVSQNHGDPSSTPALIVLLALLLTWKAEWGWYADTFLFVGFDDRGLFCLEERDPDSARNGLAVLLLAISYLFGRTPYLFKAKSVWMWIMAALAGVAQFWLVYSVVRHDFFPERLWLLPLLFAAPLATSAWYLAKKRRVAASDRLTD